MTTALLATFHMEYLPQQFIAAAKKIRDELQAISMRLSVIHDDLEKQTEEIGKVRQAADQKQSPPLEVRAIVHTPEGVQAEQREYQTKQGRYQGRNLIATWAGVFVVAAYTTFAALQWCQMRRATNLAQKANDDAWTLADRANRTAVGAERPWIGVQFAVRDWEPNKSPSTSGYFINSGRRPAKVTLVAFDHHDYRVFPKDPLYHRYATDVKSVALIVPGGNVSNTQPLERLDDARIHELELRRQTLFIYATIEYEDVLTNVKHWTHACWQYLPNFRNDTSGFVNCAVYNEVDPEKQEAKK